MATLTGLHPQLLPWAKWLLEVGRYYDSRLVVTSGYRDSMKQAQLYDRWQRGLSEIPAAAPGRSLHQYGLAFDLARVGVPAREDSLLQWLGQVWASVGGASWGNLGSGSLSSSRTGK